jgi:hypothetical protein
MKKGKETELNSLCLTCRRACKQSAAAIIADCRRYYQGVRTKRYTWRQRALPLDT